MANEIVKRYMVADYLNTSATDTPNWLLMGAGFKNIDENPGPQKVTETYINDVSATTTITRYEASYPFDTKLIKNQDVVMDLYDIARDRKTGSDAERDYVRVELFRPVSGEANTYKSRKMRVSVEVTGVTGEGGNEMRVAGNLNNVGDFVDGKFNTVTKVFTEVAAADLFLVTFSIADAVGQIAGAVVVVGGVSYTANANGIAEVLLAAGTHAYTVAADGYVQGTGNAVVTTGAKFIEVTLTEDS